MTKVTKHHESQLLYTRKQAAALLGGSSIDFIVALEKAGKLTPIRLNGPHSRCLYRHHELIALVDANDSKE